MPVNENLHDLLTRYGVIDDELGFHAVWCAGRTPGEVAGLLRVSPGSAAQCRLDDPWEGLDQLNDRDGVLFVGAYRDWTLVLQTVGVKTTRDPALSILSSGGRRALAIGWDVNLRGRLTYAADGRILASMVLFPPGRPRGIDPRALEQYMDGIPFEDGPDMEAHAVSALRLAARITDGGVDRAWLESPQTRWIIPADAWYYGW
ncbi:DUF6461 domain-containing protein [Nonomuraea sp. NPDC004580]|uniref:DUF6461 domain-containing protein n=1 Tax=Nonomuraea sp. NPDC004580 TaxID=3154552 RepID=UPI00339F65C5